MLRSPSSHFERDIIKYYAYMALSNLIFFLPVDVLFFKERGLDVTQIFHIQGIFAFGIFLFEIPTGVIADRFGRKNSLLLGVIAWIVADFIFFFGWNFGVLAFAYLLWSLGLCLNSGADTALLHNILQKNEKHGAFAKYQGNARLVGLLAVSLSAIIGSAIASFSIGWTFLISAIALIPCLFVLQSIQHQEKSFKQKPSFTGILSLTFKTLQASKGLVWLISISVVFAVTFQFFRPLMQIYLQQAKLNTALFGVATAFLFASGALAAKAAYWFEGAAKKAKYAILSIALVAGVFLIHLFLTQWGFLFFGILAFTCTVNSILVEHEVLKATPEGSHASMLSFNSLLSKVIFAGLSPLFGYSLQTHGLEKSVGTVVLVLAVVCTFLVLFHTFTPCVRKLLNGIKPISLPPPQD